MKENFSNVLISFLCVSTFVFSVFEHAPLSQIVFAKSEIYAKEFWNFQTIDKHKVLF